MVESAAVPAVAAGSTRSSLPPLLRYKRFCTVCAARSPPNRMKTKSAHRAAGLYKFLLVIRVRTEVDLLFMECWIQRFDGWRLRGFFKDA